MFFKTLLCAVSAVIGVSVAFGGDEDAKKEDASAPAYDKRKVALTASRSVKTRKVRKGVIPPEYGIHSRDDDFSKDDKMDLALIKVKVVNKTGKKLDGFRLVCEFYGRNVGIRKKIVGPIGAEEVAVEFDAKGVFQCELKKYTLFDRNEDEYEVGKRTNMGDKLPTYQLQAHGVMFYGYKVTLFDGEDNVVKEVLWPSSLKKIDLDDRLLEWEVPKPPMTNVGGGTLDDFVSPSKNPPGSVEKKKNEDDAKDGKKDDGASKKKKGWRDAL